jgi:hypothetical protein
MGDVEDQRNVFEFLCDRLDSQESFTKDELGAVTDWSPASLNTYWSKQFRPFVRKVGGNEFRVTEGFRPFATWEKFRQHVTQVRQVTATDYTYREYANVLIYEFFMPLTNEPALRGTLDNLFYKDTILSKLRSIGVVELNEQLKREDGESDEQYLDRICGWISEAKLFVGYSISHVSGRFRGAELATRKQAAEIEKRQRYLVDETTAVTRFIFPCKEDEVERVRWFFNALFVESIIEVVNGEDEIWMVESGMRSRLHIWRVEAAE